ncbi:hypothetical protein [Mycobacterium paragordonae]|uniref:hypothetical protein n=1 Tax=Mycobacterium paragordonae TaxID=1389713 RepID=UPI0035313C33
MTGSPMVFGTLVAGLLLGRDARSVLAERVGWTGSISWFRERVRLALPGAVNRGNAGPSDPPRVPARRSGGPP